MSASPLDAHRSTPEELRERIAAERRGRPFLVYRDAEAAQRIVGLDGLERVAVGRSPECEVPLAWDPEVSRLHAELERVGDQWVAVDDGLSTNGTFVDGERLSGRRRLADGDLLQAGDVAIVFRDPVGAVVAGTRPSGARRQAAAITPAQRRVLIALCRPFKGGAADATPATNPQIAAELVLTVAAVKTHLRAICRAFEIDDLPQQEKRRKLVALTFGTGLVTDRDL